MSFFLLTPNLIDSATVTGTGWLPELPITNVQDRVLQNVARSDGVTAPTINIALDRPRPVRGIVLMRDTVGLSGSYRIIGSNNSDFSAPIYDSDVIERWPRIFDSANLEWDDPRFWDGKPLQEDIDGLPQDLIHVLPADISAQYWRIELTDTGVNIGRIMIAGGWQPSLGPEYGATIAVEDQTLVSEADAGTEYFNNRPRRRIARLRLPILSKDEALQQVLESQLRYGIQAEIFLIIDADDQLNLQRQSFVCRLQEPSAMEYAFFDHNSANFILRELL
ncbi:MAG: hypothetical protein AAF141_05870 [Pseudomonadota bacterium]